MINKVAGILDRNSGTEISKKLVPSKLELNRELSADADKNAKISLYHDNYKNLATVLKSFENQAEEVVKQRDILSTTLNIIVSALEIPQPDVFAPMEFENMATYEQKREELLAKIKQVDERDNALINQLVQSAGVIGYTASADAFKDLEEYSKPLEEFAQKVEALKKRSDTYADYIMEYCEVLRLPTPTLDGDDYEDALASVKTGMQGLIKDYDDTKQDLQDTKSKLATTQDELNAKIAENDKLRAENDELHKKIEILVGKRNAKNPMDISPDILVKKLKGNILKVNKKWDFVIIDIGKKAENNKLILGTEDNPVERVIALQEGKIMDVARGNKFLGKIKIIRVNDRCAIADILEAERVGDIEKGDRVFFARTPKKKKDGEEDEENAEEDDNASMDDEDMDTEAEDIETMEDSDSGADDADLDE
jgi:predicted nuclease with TOPRIM domain